MLPDERMIDKKKEEDDDLEVIQGAKAHRIPLDKNAKPKSFDEMFAQKQAQVERENKEKDKEMDEMISKIRARGYTP
jgi:hypothetical protein